jgi:hypothetical protein
LKVKKEVTVILTKEVVVTTSAYKIILIMANHIHILTTSYMEQNMKLMDLLSHLDWILNTTKMSLVMYVDVEEVFCSHDTR